jgi:hypothetical protein
MGSKFFELDGGEEQPVVLEISEDRVITWHGYDLEAEQAAIELGFAPSPCAVIYLNLSEYGGDANELLELAVREDISLGGLGYDETGDSIERQVLIDNHFVAIALALGADPDLEAGDDDNETALALAANYGFLPAVQELLAAGADVHGGDDQALEWAAGMGHADIVQTLLEAGADVTAGNYQALRNAMWGKKADAERVLRDWMTEHGIRIPGER